MREKNTTGTLQLFHSLKGHKKVGNQIVNSEDKKSANIFFSVKT